MKKALLILAFLVILVAIPLTVFLVKQQQQLQQRATKATSLFFSPAYPQNNPLSVNVGDQFDLNVQMDPGPNQVVGVQLTVSYDAQYLQVVDLQPQGTLLPNIIADKQLSSGTATITLGAPSSTNPATGTGNIAKVTFKALANTSSPTTINLGQSQVSGIDDPGRNLLAGSESASVMIGQATGGSPNPSASAGGPSTTPQPSVSPSAGSTSPSPSATGGTGGTGTASPTPSATPAASGASPSPSSSSTTTTKITSPTDGSTVTSARPTISGVSFANALMILTISGGTPSSTFYADASGNWSFTPTSDLGNGNYTVTVTGDNNTTGVLETVSSTFTVSAGGTGGTAVASPTPTPAASLLANNNTTTTTTTTQTSTSTTSAIPQTGATEPTIVLLTTALLLIAVGSFATFFFK